MFHTTTSRALLVALAASATLLGACGDPDGSPDASRAVRRDEDGGVREPRAPVPGDRLVASASSVSLAPGLMTCLELRIETREGESRPLDVEASPVSLQGIDRSVATPTEPGDCPQLGLIGVAPGTTSLDVVLRTSEAELWTRIHAEVRDVPYELRIGDQVVPAGERARYDGGGTCLGPCPRLVFPEARVRGVWLVPRWVSLRSLDEGVARLERDDDQWVVVGRRVGETAVEASYRPERGPEIVAPLARIVVPSDGRLANLNCVQLEAPRAPPSEACPALHEGSALRTGGACLVPWLLAHRLDETTGASWVTRHSEDAGWTVTGRAELRLDGEIPRVCPSASSYGDAQITGCLEGTCLTETHAVLPEDLTGFSLELDDSAPLVSDRSWVCGVTPPVTLEGPDGDRRDIRDSDALLWRITPEDPSALMAEYLPPSDGEPGCFELYGRDGGALDEGDYQLAVTVRWGQLEASGELTYRVE